MTKIIGAQGYIGSMLDLPETNHVVLLAGHSSVKMCDNDPDGAWINNVDFFRAVLNNIKPGQKLIYASSASVYDGVKNPTEETNEFNLKGFYDLTKRTIDSLALLSGKEVYGLRFATVNGYSPNLRVDVMLNKMVYDAQTTGEIHVHNPQLDRPILGIYDLRRAIRAIVEDAVDNRGIYNLASFKASVLDMATHVASKTGAKVIVHEETTHPYAFGIDTTKFESTYNFSFGDTIESLVDSLLNNTPQRTGARI